MAFPAAPDAELEEAAGAGAGGSGDSCGNGIGCTPSFFAFASSAGPAAGAASASGDGLGGMRFVSTRRPAAALMMGVVGCECTSAVVEVLCSDGASAV